MNITIIVIGVVLIGLTGFSLLLMFYLAHLMISQFNQTSELKGIVNKMTVDNSNLINYISQLSNIISELSEITSVFIQNSRFGGFANPNGTPLFDDEIESINNSDLDNQLQQRLNLLSKDEISELKRLFKDYFDKNDKK